jgi:subtilisin-like proprotein convertase family protein
LHRRFWVELLEDRCLLSATPPTFSIEELLIECGDWMLPASTTSGAAEAANSPEASYVEEDTFFLHSLPSATKTIYLDFTGHQTVDQTWNFQFNTPNIITPAFDVDGDPLSFAAEWETIQDTWEQVSELFRPFDVDVTTEDPGVDDLSNTGFDDDEWGIRVVIGGSVFDWYAPNGGSPTSIGVAYLGSFTDFTDNPTFVFADQIGDDARLLTLVTAHEVGHTLGLAHDGQYRHYLDIEPNPAVFRTQHDAYFAGHGLSDDDYGGPDDVINVNWSPETSSWGPIMGNGSAGLMQWSQGEYFNADNLQDDLFYITNFNGFGYRPDDHASNFAAALPLAIDPELTDGDLEFFFDEGIIEENTDIDFFSFEVGLLGQILSFDINNFYNGANMDILARVYDSAGVEIARSNPLSLTAAGSQTYGQTYGTLNDGGWIVSDEQFEDYAFDPDAEGYFTQFILPVGTYYLSVEGTGKPLQFLDTTDNGNFIDWLPPPPSSIHPGPILRHVKDDILGQSFPDEDPDFVPIPLPPDNSDYGYSNYGSLGYYSIIGTRKSGLLVGVDFDVAGGVTPTNWNLYSGGAASTTLLNLTSETGILVPYKLSISTTADEITTFGSDAPIDSDDLPQHSLPLNELRGFISDQDETITFTWTNLEASKVYEVYVFGHADFGANNQVTITGGTWNGLQQVFDFTQSIAANDLVVNNFEENNDPVSLKALLVVANEDGEITIEVTNEAGSPFAVAGLAIAPTKVGSITGTKYNDNGDGNPALAGNGAQDPGEPGLANWLVYVDLDNDGQLDIDPAPEPNVSQDSGVIDQPLSDNVTVTSEINFLHSGTITDVNVKIDISHQFTSDIHVWLISPSGTRVKLVGDVGLGGDNFEDTVFDDEASVSIVDGNAPFAGTFRPQQPLAGFDDENSFGKWKLEVFDDSQGDTGVLHSWTLFVELLGVASFLEPVALTDLAGNYSFTNLQPGDYYIREHFTDQQIAAGWVQTQAAPAPLTVRSGANVADVDFGNWIPVFTDRGSIQGQKWSDADQDGVKDANEPGLEGWIVYIDADGDGIRDLTSAPVTESASDLPKPITDFGATRSQITFDGVGDVFSVEVTLDITHTSMVDLDAYLFSPSGRQVKLFSADGGPNDNFQNLTFADDAARSIESLTAADHPFTGRWRPEEALSAFIGDELTGNWTLEIRDTAFADEGTLNSWSLNIITGEAFEVTDEEGLYVFDNLTEGTYVIREEAQPGWQQMQPVVTEIPSAVWNGSQWEVQITNTDVTDVDFGNYGPVGSIQGMVYADYNGNFGNNAAEPGLAGWTVFIDEDGNGTRDLGSLNESLESDESHAINDVFPVSSKIWVGGIGRITDLNVSLDITHTYDEDLTVRLVSPAGTSVLLFSGVGGGGDDFDGTTFDDAATETIGNGTAPFAGTFRPVEALSAFNGENAHGFWTLQVVDNSSADFGTLNEWGLSILGDELATTTNLQGLYAFTNLEPGTYDVKVELQPGWSPTETPGAVTVTPAATVANVNFGVEPSAFPGDFNGDSNVDTGDYIVWRQQAGTAVPNGTGADGNGDGVVDQADLNIWRTNFGAVFTPPSASNGAGLADAQSSESASQATGYEGGPVVTLVVTPAASVAGAASVTSNSDAPAMSASAAGISMPFFNVQSSVGVKLGGNGVLTLPAVGVTLSNDQGLLAWLSSHSADSDAADGQDDTSITTPIGECDLESLDEMFAALEADLSPVLW